MINYVTAIMHIVPDARISYNGANVAYENIQWLDDRPMPTKEACEQAYPQAQYENDYAQVQSQRQLRYTNETDGLFFDAMRADGNLAEWKAACEIIKTELPYPAAPTEA